MSERYAAGAASRRALAAAGDRVLLIDLDGRTLTGEQIARRVERLAGTLAEHGLAGRRIGLWYRNGTAAFEAFLAVEWIGATRLVVDPEVPPGEAQAVFDAGSVDLVVADDEHAGAIGGDVVVHDIETTHRASAWTDEPSVDPDTPLIVYPRSVAAGELFSVTTSYANWDAIMRINIELYTEGWYGPRTGTDECALTMQQLMHGTGMVTSFPFLLMGLPQVIIPKFDATTALDVIGRHQVTSTFAVPGMLTRLADAVGQGSTRLPLRRTLYGGAPLEPEELRRVRRVLGESLVQLYGRFEAGWPLAVLGPDEHARILDGNDELAHSCGLLVPQIEARIVPPNGMQNDRGELQTRNPMVSPQYADPEGWCALGDLAHLDDAGYLYLDGRIDGMINTGSYHVYPGQVEDAISSVRGVRAVRVTGEPDPVWGQAVTAHIVTDDSGAWEELVARLEDELSDKLARYKIPKAFRHVDRLPE